MSHKTPSTVSSDVFLFLEDSDRFLWTDRCKHIQCENFWRNFWSGSLSRKRLILTNPQPAEYRDQFVVKWGHHIREVLDSNLQMFMLVAYLNLWSLQSCASKMYFMRTGIFLFLWHFHLIVMQKIPRAQSLGQQFFILLVSGYVKMAKVETWFKNERKNNLEK